MESTDNSRPADSPVPPAAPGAHPRAHWESEAVKVVRPVFRALAQRRLKADMPVECRPGEEQDRRHYTCLEALGRSLAGIGPWLNLAPQGDSRHEAVREALFQDTLAALEAAVDPASPDCMNFSRGRQPLVDAAFLAQGLLRSFDRVWPALDESTRLALIDNLRQTRSMLPGANNWILFPAMIEAFLRQCGAEWDPVRIDYAVRQHEQWYLGDGLYGDGPPFHADYYNSYVIQPMLLDTLNAVADTSEAWNEQLEKARLRARRHAAIQERMISPDGSYPPLGRSLAYRGGAFQGLAQMALFNDLPAEVSPGQARCALGAVIKRTLQAPGTFDENGWLRIGVAGSQPSLGEVYISTGSLYLCSTIFLPLGLYPDQDFWTQPDTPWTSRRIWNGEDLPPDHAIPG